MQILFLLISLKKDFKETAESPKYDTIIMGRCIDRFHRMIKQIEINWFIIYGQGSSIMYGAV